MSEETTTTETTTSTSEETAGAETKTESTETTTESSAKGEGTETASLGDAISNAGTGDESGKSVESKDSEETTASEDGESGSDAEGQPQGAPEEYAAFDVPEGYAWSEKAETNWAELMKESNVSQEDAQQLLGIMAEQTKEFGIPDLQRQQDEEFAGQRKEWLGQAEKDPVLGGENGENFKANLALAAKVLATVDEGLKSEKLGYSVTDTMKKMGWLDHPAALHILVGLGRRTLPDSLDPPGDGGGESKSWDEMSLHEKLGYNADALAPDEIIRGTL